ncbi:MAG: UDP-N-acetylmuramate dehydrogenase [Desulfobacterales bacterium]|nr:UDP-N-acetylmuramate dehydrogenase [Desulfobacterales bacterium]
MRIETNVNLKAYNTFGLPARAGTLIRIYNDADIDALLAHSVYGPAPKFVLGGGSNLVLSGAPQAMVLKVEIMGRRLLREEAGSWIVEAGAGEDWPDLVSWTLDQGWPGLENLALIPGTVGAGPVQNIGAYGVELQARFDSLDGVDLRDGRRFTLDAAACRFGYRDSIFKRELAGRCLITRVRLRLPKPWRPVLDYPDVRRECLAGASPQPDARRIFDVVCALRRAKLPDPKQLGSAGSFFKNPVVNRSQLEAIKASDPACVCYPLPDGQAKLSAGRLIEACGWKGRRMGRAAVYAKQALVLVNEGAATGQEVLALAAAIQDSVYDRFGIRLEIEPVVL